MRGALRGPTRGPRRTSMNRPLSCCVAVLMSLLALSAPAVAQPKPAAWDMTVMVGITHFVGGVEKEFLEDVSKRTNGALAVTLRPPGELPYKLTEYLRTVGQGNVQMCDVYMG